MYVCRYLHAVDADLYMKKNMTCSQCVLLISEAQPHTVSNFLHGLIFKKYIL